MKIIKVAIILCIGLLSCNLGDNKKTEPDKYEVTEAPKESLDYLKKVAIPLNISGSQLMNEDEILKDEIESARIILSGEVHFTSDFRTLNLDFIKHFYRNYGIKYYLAEMNWVEAYYINKYINGGNEKLLDDFFIRNKDTNYAFNETYNFFKKLRTFNLMLPKGESITYLGADITGHWDKIPVASMLNDLLPNDTATVSESIKEGINEIKESLLKKRVLDFNKVLKNIEENQEKYKKLLGDGYDYFFYSLNNTKESFSLSSSVYSLSQRDEAIYKNVLGILDLYPKMKFYASWGTAHLAKRRHNLPFENIEKYKSWAAWTQDDSSVLKDKVLTFYACPVDTVVDGNLPPGTPVDTFESISKKFEEAGDSLGKNHILFPLNRENSPFSKGLYCIPGPVDGGVTTDYFDYMLYVKGSKMMEKYFEEK